jgi:hypothetical protein
VPLGRNRARPKCTVWAQLGRPTQRAAHGVSARRRHCMAAALLGEPTVARRTGDGGERRLTGTDTAARRDGDGRAARDGNGPRRRRLRTAAVRTARRAVGATVARARRAVGTRGTLSRQRLQAAASAWRVAATRQRRAATRAWLGARRLTSGARCSVISEIKNHPEGK